jgi:hypothetical protein
MEPNLPKPSPSPEMGGYQRREAPPAAPERSAQPNVEAQPDSREKLEVQQHAPSEPIVIPALPAQPFLPTPTQSTPTQSADDAATSGNPLVAGDDDLIEKEWVDKAKKIVHETKNDPYVQEREVSKLQADYMKKRYGKDIKLIDE